MSALVMGLVWELPQTPEFGRAEKIILLAYADHADSSGRNIYPSVELMRQKTFYEERAVQLTTRKLVKNGFLVPDGKGPHGTNRFRIPLQVAEDGGAKIAPVHFSTEIKQKNAPEGNAPEPSLIKPLTTTTAAPAQKSAGGIERFTVPAGEAGEIFRMFENEFGLLTPLVRDALNVWIDDPIVPNQWILDAMRRAVVANVRNWSYVEAILKAWKAKGAQDTRAPRGDKKHANGRSAHTKPQGAETPAEYSEADRAAAERVRQRRAGGQLP